MNNGISLSNYLVTFSYYNNYGLMILEVLSLDSLLWPQYLTNVKSNAKQSEISGPSYVEQPL